MKSIKYLFEFSTWNMEWGVGQKGLRGRQRVGISGAG